MTKELVIARYLEDLAWSEQIRPEVAITVYNKSPDPTPGWNIANWINVPNEGREAETYLRHILRNYETLADLTFFVQGDPFPHAPELVHQITGGEYDTFQALAHWHPVDNQWGEPHHGGLPVGPAYEAIFGRSSPPHFEFGAGACFAVARHAVHSKPLAFYRYAFTQCQALFPREYPWIMERLWPRLFLDPLGGSYAGGESP
jgi:hypothetical protein